MRAVISVDLKYNTGPSGWPKPNAQGCRCGLHHLGEQLDSRSINLQRQRRERDLLAAPGCKG